MYLFIVGLMRNSSQGAIAFFLNYLILKFWF